jgi:hypothetical protein
MKMFEDFTKITQFLLNLEAFKEANLLGCYYVFTGK